MKQKLNSLAGAALRRIRPDRGRRMAFRCLMALTATLLVATGANANQVGEPTNGTILPKGSTTTISNSTVFPLKILYDSATYIIVGNYQGDYGPPSGYSGAALTSAQVTERKTPAVGPNGMINVGGSNHGIYVKYGLKNVTVILKNVGLETTGTANAAFIIDGVNTSGNVSPSTYQNQPNSSNVVIQLAENSKNFLYSCMGQNNGNRAAIEVWKGSTVYIEGKGSLLAATGLAGNRSYSGEPASRAPSHEHPQGTPYWAGNTAALTEPNGGGGAAGIGAGNISGSGGNVVIRGEPTVIAIAGTHGAGIGGGWYERYNSDVLIYGGTVESWGGGHGAGIGGGCTNRIAITSLEGTIVVLPTAKVYAASYSGNRTMLGQMRNVIYFGNPNDSRLAVYTEDYREVDMFLDVSKSPAVRSVIERLGGGMNPSYLPLGKTRNDWPSSNVQHRPNYEEWAETTVPAIEKGVDKYVLLLNGGFSQGLNIAFLTAAKTEKNHSYNPVTTISNSTAYRCHYNTVDAFDTYGLDYPSITDGYNNNSPKALHYAPSTATLRPVPRFVMIAPTYKPDVSLTPTTPPELTVGYLVTHTDNKITLTIGNTGNQKLYNPRITIIGDDYELATSPGTPLQDAVDTKLLSLLASDANGPYIPLGASFPLELRLKAGKSPGTSYDGWVLFSADNLPDAAVPRQFNIHVLDKFLQPPDLVMETPADTVVSGPYQLRAKFKNQLGVYPHPVTDLQTDDIFIDYGTVTAVAPVSSTEIVPGYFSDWIIDVTPTPGLPNKSMVSVAVKQDAAEDQVQASTRTVSTPKLVTFSSEGPYVSFNVAEGATLSSLDTILVYVNGNGITPGKEDSAYVGGKQFTATGVLAGLQTDFRLTQLPSTLLDIATAGEYVLSVTDENNLKIGSPAPVGFPNGDYELDVPAGYIHNYDGNYLSNTQLHFSIHMPEILDGAGVGGAIIPPALPAAGGNVRIWVYGKHLMAAKGKLIIVFNDNIPGYGAGYQYYVPSAQFTDTTAYIDVALPPNLTDLSQAYDFTIRLIGRQPSTDVTPDLTATVNATSAVIDTTRNALGYREGLHAWPHTQTFEGGPVDLRLVGENLFRLNLAPTYSNLRIRVKKDGSYISREIPVPTPSTLGAVAIPLGAAAFTTEKNLSPHDAVYVFELWHDVSGTPTPVAETSSGMPYVSDSTTVKSGLDDLIQTLRRTHHVVSQRVANTPPTVRAWLVPQLNAIAILRSFGLTVSEDDITFTDFDSAVEGTMALPMGSNGRFVFTLKLNTVPDAVSVTLNTGEIEAVSAPPVMLERDVIIPEAPGYATDPPAGHHHVESGRDFTFYLVPESEETRMITAKVTTNRRVGSDGESVTVESKEDGAYYFVTIRQIRESITVYINGKDDSAPDANEEVAGTKAWGEYGRLHIRSVERGRATVYNTLGAQVATVALEAGEDVAVSLPAGIYLVSLRGETYRALVK